MSLHHSDEPHQLAGGEAMRPFFEKAYQAKLPVNVQLQITDLCNLRCEHCYNSTEHKHKELSFEEIDNLLGQLKKAGALYLCLTGGEPTLHPRFFDIARAVRNHGLVLEVITNATLLRDEHYALFHELK
ncbi:MAG: radical SAM protein, partial [Planctomycetes bacterium]|nr:radical SAM protein [Planctomycetota bacterium]